MSSHGVTRPPAADGEDEDQQREQDDVAERIGEVRQDDDRAAVRARDDDLEDRRGTDGAGREGGGQAVEPEARVEARDPTAGRAGRSPGSSAGRSRDRRRPPETGTAGCRRSRSRRSTSPIVVDSKREAERKPREALTWHPTRADKAAGRRGGLEPLVEPAVEEMTPPPEPRPPKSWAASRASPATSAICQVRRTIRAGRVGRRPRRGDAAARIALSIGLRLLRLEEARLQQRSRVGSDERTRRTSRRRLLARARGAARRDDTRRSRRRRDQGRVAGGRRHAPLAAAGRRRGARDLPPRGQPQQALDRARPQGRGDARAARALCERADVVVSNFRPGTLERFGLGYERVAARQPGRRLLRDQRLRRGRGRDLPGYDPLVQAVGGLMSITGPPGGRRRRASRSSTSSTALYATVAVLAALYARATERPRAARHDRPAAHQPRDAREPVDRLARGGDVPLRARQHPSEHRAVRDLPRGGRRADDLRAGTTRSSSGCADARRCRSSPPTSDSGERAPRANRDELSAQLEARARAATRGRVARPRCPRPASRPGRCRRSTRRSRSPTSLGLDVVDETGGVRTVAFPAHLSRDACRDAPAARPTWTSTATRFEPPLSGD